MVALSASQRDKGFVSGDAQGGVHLNYGTSGATLLSLMTEGRLVRSLAFAPKADAVFVADARGKVGQWRIDNPHPEVTLKTLFGKVWYEGYSAPALRLAVNGRHRRLRGQVQPDPADFRHPQGHDLRVTVRHPPGVAGRAVRERVHASRHQGLRQAGGRDHGGAPQRGTGLSGRPVAGARARAHRAGAGRAAPGTGGVHPDRSAWSGGSCRCPFADGCAPAARYSCSFRWSSSAPGWPSPWAAWWRRVSSGATIGLGFCRSWA